MGNEIDEGLSRDQAEAMESLLQAFVKAVAPTTDAVSDGRAAAGTPMSSELAATDSMAAAEAASGMGALQEERDGGAGSARVEARLDALQHDVAWLRRSMASSIDEIKANLAALARERSGPLSQKVVGQSSPSGGERGKAPGAVAGGHITTRVRTHVEISSFSDL